MEKGVSVSLSTTQVIHHDHQLRASSHSRQPGRIMGTFIFDFTRGVQGVSRVPLVSLLTLSIPYAPYSKSDKISRIADWHADYADAPTNRRMGGQRYRTREAYGAADASAFGYVHEEDEKSFLLVDSGANRTSSRGRGVRGRGGRAVVIGRGANRGATRGGPARGGFNSRGRGGRWGGYDNFNKGVCCFGRTEPSLMKKPQRIRDSSVTIGPDWRLIDELEFARLAKLSLSVEEAEDMYVAMVPSPNLSDQQRGARYGPGV